MKKMLFFCMLEALVVGVQAKPLFVGHRGSGYGLENSTEAFINGAKLGYDYLETDVKVTKDGQFVCCHNDDLTTWGGTLTLASSTLAALQAETLSQTRYGKNYTGHLCSIAEYLDVCNQQNVKPLIELKWATGINNNDCSKIPALISLIESKGFRKSCIILTSMQTCLTYIKTNYPDVMLQYLVNSVTDASYTFCNTNRIDIDPASGGVTKADVVKFHAVGLKINMWTANTIAAYETYGNMGCDFITTDTLSPKIVPDLETDVNLISNTIDYPNIEGTPRITYTPILVSTANIPSFLDGTTIRKVLVRDDKYYILALKADNTPILTVLNSETGVEIQRMSLTGVASGTLPLSDIAFTSDGVLLGCNQAVVPFAGGGEILKVYKWASDVAVPELFISIDNSPLCGNWSNSLAGGRMAASGNLNSLYLFITNYSNSSTYANATHRIQCYQVDNGTISKSYYCQSSDYTTANWGDDFTLTVSPFNRLNLIVNSSAIQPKEYIFSMEGSKIPMIDYKQMVTGTVATTATGMAFLRYGGKVYAAMADCTLERNNAKIGLVDVSGNIDVAGIVSPFLPEASLGTAAISHLATGIEYDTEAINIYLFAQGEGMAKYTIDMEGGVPPIEDVDFMLENVWENSTVNGNAPDHINGTNAQQGGAEKGCFYVNDCVDKKLYIFNQTGCLGSLTGGAGWGTALDDAGNVIIRNDKNTTADHSFIIYPSGTKIGSAVTPTTLQVTVPLAGQTNFISASGNVLDGTGHIYLYPNGQTGVNVLTVTDGDLKSANSYTSLSMTGTTAGYVIPIGDNLVNWIYQVRGTGYHSYNAGTNAEFLTGTSSVTPPSRNSTVGGDYFTLAGHTMFVHPSGENYKGGFTVRDLSTDKIISNVTPIGTLGYETGGNYSCSNWIFAESIDDKSCYLYLYTPANGMAVYRLTANSKSQTGLETAKAVTLKVYPNPTANVVRVETRETVVSVAVMDITGARYQVEAKIEGTIVTIDMGTLPMGCYFVRINDGHVVKVIKK